jgi:hypothetical protein
MLLIVSAIPKSLISDNVKKTGQTEKTNYLYIIDGCFGTKQDNYADYISVNIAYNIDSSDLVKSVLKSGYYDTGKQSQYYNLRDLTTQDKKSNTDYIRYWHGYEIFLRPLLIITDLDGARFIYGALTIAITALLIAMIIRRKNLPLAVCYLLGLISIDFWMITTTIEYTSVFLISAACSIILLKYDDKRYKDDGFLGVIFICSGILTAFFDFLTTETLAFTVPYFIITAMRAKDGRLGDYRKCKDGTVKFDCSKKWMAIKTVKCGIGFVAGYAGMFLLKWLLAAAAFGMSAFTDSIKHAAIRMESGITAQLYSEKITSGMRIYGDIWENLGCLFHFRNKINSSAAMLTFAVLLIVTFAVIYLFREDGKNVKNGCQGALYEKEGTVYMILAAIPFIRFLIVSNHSYMHFFFTFRALLIFTMFIFYYTYLCTHKRIRKIFAR